MDEKVMRDSEHELMELNAIRQAQNGEAVGFEYLYRSTSKRVYGICLRMLKNTADAEDLTQQVFLQLFRNIGSFRGESRFSTWAHRVTVNAVLMHLRRKRPVEIHPESAVPPGTDLDTSNELEPHETSMSGAIDRLNLRRAIRRLPAGFQRSFVLHDVMGYKHHEIAGLVGCSIGTSKSQVHKARRRLQQLLCGEKS